MAKDKFILPGVEDQPGPGTTYRVYSSKYMTKEDVKKYYKRRYGIDPAVVFFGPPKGSMIYAGPVPGTGSQAHITRGKNGNNNKSS